MYARISFPRSVAASLMVVYSANAGVAPKGRRRQRKASFNTITMYVTDICALVWTRRYVVSRSVLSIRISFEGHLIRMAEIMWSILRKHNLQKNDLRVSFSTRFFTDSSEGPGKEKSWVTRLLV